jgi:peptide/nickel transport system permease protein
MAAYRSGTWAQRTGASLLVVIVFIALAAPVIAPHAASAQFPDRAYAPPTRVHVFEHGVHAPSIHPLVLEDRLASRYREDTAVNVPLRWLSGGHLVQSSDPNQPLMLLGADALGRDVFSRVVSGARLSLGVTLVGVLGALLLGAAVGSLAGVSGPRMDDGLMFVADFLLALPGAYLVLVLRALLDPIDIAETFTLIALLFAVSAWPHAARGVRAIVAFERTRDYAEAARAAGAGPWRIARQLLPAARGFLAVELVLLVPALLVAEATISYLGLGFPDTDPSWGILMHDAANGPVLVNAPWMLAPAVGVFIVVLGAQLFNWKTRTGPVFW